MTRRTLLPAAALLVLLPAMAASAQGIQTSPLPSLAPPVVPGQTLPAVVIALYTRFFNPWALLAGWASGMVAGTWMAATLSFKGSIYALHLFGLTIPCYAAISALVLNIAVATVLSLILNALSNGPRFDETVAEDYV